MRIVLPQKVGIFQRTSMNHTELIQISFKAEAGKDPALLSFVADSTSGLVSKILTTSYFVPSD